jgi:membrane protein implicated in regulation of membrane protease activity
VGRARVAFLGAIVGASLGLASFAYLAFILMTRTPHSGVTTDINVALVMMFAGILTQMTGTILRRRWRVDYFGREAIVSRILKDGYASVRVDGIPYLAFAKEEFHKGDRVLLQAPTLDGVPVRSEFVAFQTGIRDQVQTRTRADHE